MTTTRPYRPAMSDQAALAELRRCAGTQFDPTVVDAFLRTRDRAKITEAARPIGPLGPLSEGHGRPAVPA
jgi:HD-GYP domain-containing protein (c-di-GMP phosphodiesterase class II)